MEILDKIYKLPETKNLLWEGIFVNHLDELKMKIRKYDLEIYPLSIIRQGAKDYSHIAKIVVIPIKNQVTCYFTWCKAD